MAALATILFGKLYQCHSVCFACLATLSVPTQTRNAQTPTSLHIFHRNLHLVIKLFITCICWLLCCSMCYQWCRKWNADKLLFVAGTVQCWCYGCELKASVTSVCLDMVTPFHPFHPVLQFSATCEVPLVHFNSTCPKRGGDYVVETATGRAEGGLLLSG